MIPSWRKPSGLKGKLALVAIAFFSIGFGVTASSAASLGQNTIAGLGTSSGSVPSCTTSGLSVSWDTTSLTYSPALGGYTYTRVLLDSISPSCDGRAFGVVVAQSDGSSVMQTSGASLPASRPITLTAPTALQVAQTGQVTLVIYN